MTLPNGADGLTPGIEYVVTYGNGSLQGLVGRTQAEITAALAATRAAR
jgi:hypothetical protein